MSAYDYLQEGFDPHSLKISELRRILTENTIAYPSSSKKKELIKLYYEFVVPMIPELREKHEISKSDNNNNNNESDIEVIESKTDIGRKRKLEDNFQRSFHSRNSSISSVSSIEEQIIKELREHANSSNRPKRKKTKYNGEDDKTTQILQKTATRNIAESLNEDMVSSSEFEITNSSISEEEINQEQDISEELKKENVDKEHSIQKLKKKKTSLDFSYKKKNLSQNLNNLKVSSGFAEQIQKAVIEKEREKAKVSNVTKSESPDYVYQSEVPSEFDNNQSQKSILIEDINEKRQFLNDSITKKTKDYYLTEERNDVDIVKETIISRNGTPVSSNDLITTPNLLESPDVIVSESSIEQTQGGMSDMNKDFSQPEDVSWLTNPTKQFDTADVIDLEESEKENKTVVIDLEEVEVEKDNDEHVDNDFNEDTAKHRTDSFLDNSSILAGTKKSSLIKKVLKFMVKIALWTIFGVLLLFIVWFYQNAIHTGYCGQQQHFPTFKERYPDFEYSEKIDSILRDYKSNCIPCPDSGICFPYMKLKCKPGYRVERSPIDIFGLFPFKNKCVKDNRKKELINQVVSKSLEFLRLRNAQLARGESRDNIGDGIDEDDLFNISPEAKSSSVDDEEFQHIWRQVVELLKNKPDIIYRYVSIIEFFEDDNNNNKSTTHFTNKLL